MQPLRKRLLYWIPRILTIAFAIFISLFALDVFRAGIGFWDVTLALLIHLIPTAVVLGVLALSWRREWIGAIIYIALAILYIVRTWGRFPLSTYLIIAGPLILIGVLFMLNWVLRGKFEMSPKSNSKQPPSA
jgi:hypothetical protein